MTGPPTDAVEPAVASDGDLSAAYWSDFATNVVRVSISDGRGLSWSAPVRVDGDSLGAGKASEVYGIHVAGNDVYVAWRDERLGASQDEVFFNRSSDRGVSWVGESRIDHGLPPAVAGVRDWRMEVVPDAGGDHVYFLLAVDPMPPSDEDLYLVASHDGGMTFGAAVSASALPSGQGDVDDIDLAADGLGVYVAWRDDRFGSDDEVFFQKSVDGGQTWLPSDVLLSTVGDFNDADDEVQIAASGATVAVALQEDSSCCSAHVLRATVSTDGGASWSGAKKVGTYATHVADVDLRSESMVVMPGGEVVVLWADDRLAGLNRNEIWASRSVDGGATWAADVRLSAANGGAPKVASDADRIAATWVEGTAVDKVAATFSEDAGGSWAATFFLPSPSGIDADDPHVAFNDLYGNVIEVWRADPFQTHNVYSSGYTLCVPGAPPASTTVRNGSGVNPQTLSAVSDVRIGALWGADLDCRAHAAGFAQLILWARPATIAAPPYGEILGTSKIASFSVPHQSDVVAFRAPVPPDPALCGLSGSTQAVCTGAPGARVSNALDHVVGR